MLAQEGIIYEYKVHGKHKKKIKLPFAVIFAVFLLVLSLAANLHSKTYAEAGAGGGAGLAPAAQQSTPPQEQQLDKSQPPSTSSENSSPSDQYITFKQEQAMNEGQPPSAENEQSSEQQAYPSGPSGSYDVAPQTQPQKSQQAYPSGPSGSYDIAPQTHPQESQQAYPAGPSGTYDVAPQVRQETSQQAYPSGPDGSYINSQASHPQSPEQVHRQLPEIPALRESAQQKTGKQFNPETAFPGANRPLGTSQEKQVISTPHVQPIYTRQTPQANIKHISYGPAVYHPPYESKQSNTMRNQPSHYPQKQVHIVTRSSHYNDPCQNPAISHSQTCKIRNNTLHSQSQVKKSITNPTARVTKHGAFAALRRNTHTPGNAENNVRIKQTSPVKHPTIQRKTSAQRVLHTAHAVKKAAVSAAHSHRQK